MNGPAHWREAERQLEWVNGTEPGTDDEGVRVRLGMAQVHAALALTAAVITSNAHKMEPADRHEWQRATDPGYDAGQAPGAAP